MAEALAAAMITGQSIPAHTMLALIVGVISTMVVGLKSIELGGDSVGPVIKRIAVAAVGFCGLAALLLTFSP